MKRKAVSKIYSAVHQSETSYCMWGRFYLYHVCHCGTDTGSRIYIVFGILTNSKAEANIQEADRNKQRKELREQGCWPKCLCGQQQKHNAVALQLWTVSFNCLSIHSVEYCQHMFVVLHTFRPWMCENLCLAQSDLILHVRNVFLLHSQLVRECPVSFLFELGISPLNSTQSITCCVRKDNFGKCLFWELSFCVKTGPNRSLLFSLLWPKLTFTSHVLLV